MCAQCPSIMWLRSCARLTSSDTVLTKHVPRCTSELRRLDREANRDKLRTVEEAERKRKEEEEEEKEKEGSRCHEGGREKAKGCRVHCFQGLKESQVDCSVPCFMMGLRQQTLPHSGSAPF